MEGPSGGVTWLKRGLRGHSRVDGFDRHDCGVVCEFGYL